MLEYIDSFKDTIYVLDCRSPRKGIARGFPGRGGIVAAECVRLDIEG